MMMLCQGPRSGRSVRYIILVIACLFFTPASAGVFHKDTVVEQPVGPLVEAVPQGPLHPHKPESFGKQVVRGGVFSVGVGLIAGAIKLGIFALTGIPLI